MCVDSPIFQWRKKGSYSNQSWESKIAFIFRLGGGFRLGLPLWWALSFCCKSAVDFQPHWWERVHYCNFFSFVPWTGQATKDSLLGSSANEGNLSSGPQWRRSTHRAVCAWHHRLPPFHCSMWRRQIKVSSRASTFKMAVRGSQAAPVTQKIESLK